MAGNILHFGAARLRVTGSGNLRMTLYSLDEITSYSLLPLVLQELNGREPTRLCNFSSQRAKLRIEVTAINENFSLDKITIYAKPLYTSYPG